MRFNLPNAETTCRDEACECQHSSQLQLRHYLIVFYLVVQMEIGRPKSHEHEQVALAFFLKLLLGSLSMVLLFGEYFKTEFELVALAVSIALIHVN